MKCIALGLLLVLPTVVGAQVKTVKPAPAKVPFAQSLQAIIVTAKDWTAPSATARRYERRTRRSAWKAVGNPFPVVLGRSGLAWNELEPLTEDETVPFKAEGDGKSPAGLFPLTFVFGSGGKPQDTSLPYTKLTEFTECVDDARSSHYNKIVNRMQVGNYDWTSSEKMLEIGPQYDLGVFVAYNTYPGARPGDGSCIFLHIWKDKTTPTAGCTAMNKTDLQTIVAWLDERKNPYLVQLPESAYAEIRSKWKLPKLR